MDIAVSPSRKIFDAFPSIGKDYNSAVPLTKVKR